MKINSYFFIFLPVIFVFTSCGPDAPTGPHPAFSKKSQLVIVPQFANESTDPYDTAISQLYPPACPNPGTDCAGEVIVSGGLQASKDSLFASMLSYYNNNNFIGFISSNPNWTDLFPGLTYDAPTYDSLYYGNYKIFVYPDSTITIYKNNSYTVSNFLYTFKWN